MKSRGYRENLMISIFALPWSIGWFHHQNCSDPLLYQYWSFGTHFFIQIQFMIIYPYGEVDEIQWQCHHIHIRFIMWQYCGGDEEFSYQISLVHNFVNILPLSLIVAYPCSLLRSLSATKRLEGWELWGRRYCYWRRRRPWFDDVATAMVHDDVLCCVLCAVVVVVHTLLLQMSWAWNFWEYSIQKTLASHTQKFHPKSHSARGTYSTLGPIYSTQNQEYVGCDSKSMCNLVHFERRGIRGKNSILMEFQNFHGGVRDIIHPLFHPPKCSVPTVALRDSDDDGQTTRSHLSHRWVFFQFHRWMECLERGMVMELFLFVISCNIWQSNRKINIR